MTELDGESASPKLTLEGETSPPFFAMQKMAERVGVEPTSPFGRTAFRERRLKPLGNLSNCPNQIKTIYSSIDPL